MAALTLGLVCGVTGSAGATTERGDQASFTFPVDEVDTGLCGLPISIQGQATIRFTLFSDAQGTPRRLLLHFSVADGTFSANEVSLRQGLNHNTTEILFDSAGNAITVSIVGLTTQVFLPSGAIIEAGRLVEDGLTGTVLFEAGIGHEAMKKVVPGVPAVTPCWAGKSGVVARRRRCCLVVEAVK